MENEFRHRFYDDIQRLMRRGISQFVLYGLNIYDDFFFNFGARVRNATDSLVFNLMQQENIKSVLFFNKDGLSICKLEKDSVHYKLLSTAQERKRELFGRLQSNPLRRNITDQGNIQDNSNAYNNIEDISTDSELLMILRDISEYLKNQREPASVIVGGLEWIADLYEPKNHKIEFLEEIEKWKTISSFGIPHKTFILLKSLDIIKKYYFISEDSSGVLHIGSPTVDEIYETYIRMMRGSSYLVEIEVLKKIASLVKNNGYNLRDAIYLFEEIKSSMDNHSSSEDIYTAFKDKLKVPVDEDIKWDDVILNQEIKDEILNKFNTFLQSKGEIKSGSKGFLFHGVPGTGKTIIAKALANLGGFYFMAPTLSDIKGAYVGHSAKNMQKIFKEARENAPTLIFLDELDSLFPARGSNNQDSFQADITNQFLAEVDGVNSGKQDIFIIGATNRIDIIDSAVTSRLKALEIPLPNTENREKIFKIHLKEVTLKQTQYDKLVEKTNHLSGRDIKSISADILQYTKALSDDERVEYALTKFRRQQAHELKSDYFNISLFDESKNFCYEDIISYEIEKNHLRQIVQMIVNSQNFDRFPKLKDYNGVLMYGPPGNGKSIFAEATANEFGLDYVKVIGSSLASSMQDGAVMIFDEIVRNTIKLSAMHPILLFFDEFDAIANRNMDSKLRGTLLDSIIKLRKHGNIVIMAATNKIDELDEASTRAGRFDQHIEFGNPSTKEDIVLFLKYFTSEQYFDNSNLKFDVLADMILSHYPNGVGISKIEKLCDNAKRRVVTSDPTRENFSLNMEDFSYES